MSGVLAILVIVGIVGLAILARQVVRRAVRNAGSSAAAEEQPETLHRTIVENLPDGLAVWDQSGRVLEWNPRAASMLGWSHVEALGQRLADGVLPGWQRLIQNGGQSGEFMARRRDGAEFAAEVTIIPLRQDGRPVFGALIRDVSRQQRTEAGRRQQHKMDAIGRFSGGLAHDFNNFLTVIFNILHVVEEKLPPESKLHGPVALATRAANNGADLVRRLRTVSGRQSINEVEIRVNDIVDSMRDKLKDAVGAAIDLRITLRPGLWPIFVDADQLESALVGLCTNAREAMPEGGVVTIEASNVTIRADDQERPIDLEPDDYALIAVSDTGRGMPAEVAERAFEPFFSTKEVGKGVGLGLSMVYGFARQAGGHVVIDSETGKGTRINLYLPRLSVEAADPPKEDATPPRPVAAPSQDRPTILLVEDQADLREVATAMIEGFGYKVLTAESGEAALQILAGPVTIDLLFTDIVMPGGMNGTELAAKASMVRPGLRILRTSGIEDSAPSDGGATRDEAWIAKPYRRQNLAEKLSAMLLG